MGELKKEVLRLCLVCDEALYPALEKSVEHMQEPELCKMRDALRQQSNKLYPPLTQLPGKGKVTEFSGDEYII